MRNLVEFFNDNDLRWFLDVDVFPEDYDVSHLVYVCDDIFLEYEQLRGDKFYTNFVRKTDLGIKEAAKIEILKGSYELILCGHKDSALDLLKQIKTKADSLDKIEFEIKRIIQQLQIRAVREGDKKKEKISFGKMCVAISERLDGTSIKDIRNYTVEEFIGAEQIIKERNAK